MNDISLQFNLGSTGTQFGQLSFSFLVSNNGNAHLQIWASDPSNMRRAGVLLQIAEDGYRVLKELCAKTDEAITRLKSSGQMLSMSLSYSMDVSVQVNLGSLESYAGRLTFAVVARSDGSGHLQIYASDPTNLRKSGVVVLCDEQSLQNLKQVIEKTDELIGKLLASNQMKQLVVAS